MNELTTTDWLDITFIVLFFGAYIIVPIVLSALLVF